MWKHERKEVTLKLHNNNSDWPDTNVSVGCISWDDVTSINRCFNIVGSIWMPTWMIGDMNNRENWPLMTAYYLTNSQTTIRLCYCNVSSSAIIKKWGDCFDEFASHVVALLRIGLCRFCCIHCIRDSQCLSMAQKPPQNCPLLCGSQPPSNIWFLGPTWVNLLNSMPIGSADWNVHEHDQLPDIHTDQATPSVAVGRIQ